MLLKLLRGLFGRAGLSPGDRLALARELGARKQLSAAVEQYEVLLELGIDDASVHNDLANCLSLLGRAAEALPHYRRVAELVADPHAASSVLGVLNYDPHASPDEIVQAHRTWGTQAVEQAAGTVLPPRTPASASATFRRTSGAIR